MHPDTKALATELLGKPSNQDRIALLRNAYRGATCYIVSCGPSIKAYPPDLLMEKMDGAVVFAVKQALDLVGNATDFHLFNSFNVRRYRYPNRGTVGVFCSRYTDPPVFSGSDVRFQLCQDGPETFADTVAARKNFNEYLIERRACRPWGPGIMYEVAFYLAVFLGIAEIVTLGWDVASPSGLNDHFYGSRAPESIDTLARRLSRICRIKMPKARRLANAWHHIRGENYNPSRMQPGEATMVANSTYDLYQWLLEQGVSLKVASSNKHLDPRIPRAELHCGTSAAG
jgi:hypothetical protein